MLVFKLVNSIFEYSSEVYVGIETKQEQNGGNWVEETGNRGEEEGRTATNGGNPTKIGSIKLPEG